MTSVRTLPDQPVGGRAVAWVGFVFGSVMSTAANVLYTWIPQPPADAGPGWTAPADWSPTVAAQLGAAVWPIALLLSVEALSRVLWPAGPLWALARYGGAGAVALGSAVISYGHLHGVLTAWGYGTLGAAVGPLVLDGLMVVCGFALLAPARGDIPIDQRSEDETAETAEGDEAPDDADPLLDEALRWAAEHPGPISQRAVRSQFAIGRDRAAVLLRHIEAVRRPA